MVMITWHRHACFLITMADPTVYHAGDIGLFGNMRLIAETNSIDLALLPIGDNFTMGPEDARPAAGCRLPSCPPGGADALQHLGTDRPGHRGLLPLPPARRHRYRAGARGFSDPLLTP